jgi:hypothetical protein
MPPKLTRRRRPWLLMGRFSSSRPASIVTLVVLAAAGGRLGTLVHGRPRPDSSLIPTRRNTWSSSLATDKSTLLCSAAATCRSRRLLPCNHRRPWGTLRGGQQQGGSDYGADNDIDNAYEYPANAQQDPGPYDDYRTPTYDDSNEAFYAPQSSPAPQGYSPAAAEADDGGDDDDNATEMLLHETVQDRVNTWRQAQVEQSSRLQQSARDDQGRIKLLTGVSRGSRAIIFVCLVFRNLHLFEVADQSLRGLLRLLVVTPLIGLFVANLAGVVASFTAPSHSTKKRLKVRAIRARKALHWCGATMPTYPHPPLTFLPFPTGNPEP